MRGAPPEAFLTRRIVRIDQNKCCGCMVCIAACRIGTVLAFDEVRNKAKMVDPLRCAGCLACMDRCPAGAISVAKRIKPRD